MNVHLDRLMLLIHRIFKATNARSNLSLGNEIQIDLKRQMISVLLISIHLPFAYAKKQESQIPE